MILIKVISPSAFVLAHLVHSSTSMTCALHMYIEQKLLHRINTIKSILIYPYNSARFSDSCMFEQRRYCYRG
jgi:hypothetical protein